MTSAPSETLTSTSGTDALAPSGTYTADPHPATPFPAPDHLHMAPHRHVRYTERVGSIRFTSRSLHTPTTSANYLLKRYQLREFPNVEILNTSSTASREIGNGPSKLRIIGAIILKFPFYVGTIRFATLPLIRHHLRVQKDR